MKRPILQIIFAIFVSLAVAQVAMADSIGLSAVTVNVNSVAGTATVSAALQAHSTSSSPVSLDDISVSLFLGNTVVDLSGGGTVSLDLTGFLALPLTLDDGASLPSSQLFGFGGLTPGSYTGSFFISEVDANGTPTPLETPGQDFAFTVDQTSSTVPEPSSILLLATGLAGALGAVRRNITK